MDSRGWPDIAYSFAVDSRGVAYTLRGWGVAGAHTLDWNWNSHAIFLPLGDDQEPTDAQIATARQLVADHNHMFGVGFLKGHRQAPNSTSCPGDAVMRRIAEFDPTVPQPEVPDPDQEEDDVKPFVVVDPRPGRSAWHVFGNTRYRLASQQEIDSAVFAGAKYISVNAGDQSAVDGIVNWLRSCKDLGRD